MGVKVDVADGERVPDMGIAVPASTAGTTSKLPAITQRLATVIRAKIATTIKPSAK
jgi:hypothetical protein